MPTNKRKTKQAKKQRVRRPKPLFEGDVESMGHLCSWLQYAESAYAQSRDHFCLQVCAREDKRPGKPETRASVLLERIDPKTVGYNIMGVSFTQNGVPSQDSPKEDYVYSKLFDLIEHQPVRVRGYDYFRIDEHFAHLGWTKLTGFLMEATRRLDEQNRPK